MSMKWIKALWAFNTMPETCYCLVFYQEKEIEGPRRGRRGPGAIRAAMAVSCKE